MALSTAGPHAEASRLAKRSVVLEPFAVKSSVCCDQCMSQCHASETSYVKSCVAGPALTRRCLSVGDENGSPVSQNVSRYDEPEDVANDCSIAPAPELESATLRWPESGTQ